MKKPTLLLNYRFIKRNNTLGAGYILNSLISSGLFNIGYHNYIIDTFKGGRGTILVYNGKMIYLDFWEYATPTHTEAIANHKLDLIIKLQHRKISFGDYRNFCKRKNLLQTIDGEKLESFFNKIVPWTFFPSRMFEPLINEDIQFSELPTTNLCFFCGKHWKSRHKMKDSLDRQNIEYTPTIQNESEKEYTDEEYIQKMRSSKYGIVFHGRLSPITEGKNRREVDYLFLKKPLLLNYKPYYFNNFENGKHYIYIDEHTDIKNLEDQYDIKAIAENGHRFYRENMSPLGVALSFLEIANKKLANE